ncbi:MAG: signal peptidase II [Actinomycetales bacterium]
MTDSADAPSDRPATGRFRSRACVIALIAVALSVVVIDQITKAWAVRTMLPRMSPGGDGPVEIIGNALKLTYVENTGAAFGLGSGLTVIFSLIALGVVIAILRMASKLGSLPWAIALGGLLGGAVGNLVDRLTREPGPGRGYVVDFIELPYWPVFNVADMFVVGSAILMVVLSVRGIDYRGRTAVEHGDSGVARTVVPESR